MPLHSMILEFEVRGSSYDDLDRLIDEQIEHFTGTSIDDDVICVVPPEVHVRPELSAVSVVYVAHVRCRTFREDGDL